MNHTSHLEWHANDKLCSKRSVEEFRCLERSERKDNDTFYILRYINVEEEEKSVYKCSHL